MGTETKHTPGPWKWHKCACDDSEIEQYREVLKREPTLGLNNDGQTCITDGDGRGLALAMLRRQDLKRKAMWNAEDEERDANARLIAAAPDLLAALKGCEEFLPATFKSPKGLVEGPVSLLATVKAAIAKAEGE